MDIFKSSFMSVKVNIRVSFFLKPVLFLSNLFHLQQYVAWRISVTNSSFINPE